MYLNIRGPSIVTYEPVKITAGLLPAHSGVLTVTHCNKHICRVKHIHRSQTYTSTHPIIYTYIQDIHTVWKYTHAGESFNEIQLKKLISLMTIL